MTQQTLQEWGVLERLAAQRDQYRAEADRLATTLAVTPSLDDMNRAEAELLEQLAELRRRRTDRAIQESEYRAAAEAGEFFDGLIGRTRARIEQTPAIEPHPTTAPDELTGIAGIVKDAREEIAAATGGHPILGDQLVARTGPTDTIPDTADVETLMRIGQAQAAGRRVDGTYPPPAPDGAPVDLSVLQQVREGLEQLDDPDGGDR
jgi:hypothetical protein